MNSEQLRESVSKVYAEALRKSKERGSGCCGEPRAPAGVTAKLADYGAALDLHQDAAASSFGCGNPLAFVDVAPGETVLDLGSGAGFDLLIAAERGNVHVHRAGFNLIHLRHLPDFFQQHSPAHHPALLANEERDQIELSRRELATLAVERRLKRCGLHGPLTEPERFLASGTPIR